MMKTSISQEGSQEGSLREGLEAAIRERVREIIEMVLEEEVETTLGASRHQRVAERSGYRHGRKSRRLTLRTGTVRVEVPRARLVDAEGSEHEWQSQLVPRYRRSSMEVEQSVLGVYLSGSNTRRIRRALEPLLAGAALSKSTVSRLVLRLEESYRNWQRRDLAEEKIVYLYLDAIYPKVRSGGKVVSLAILVALGVKDTGDKVLLSLTTAGVESADGWQMLLEDLAARCMGRPRLVISDGNTGLAAALDRLWPGVPHQRCTVHKLRNLMAKTPKHAQEAVREDYHRMVYAESLEVAQGARQTFLGKWKKLCPGMAASLEEAGENLLTFHRFPESQWRSLRTTNAIERMQLEFRRRVKTQAALPNEGAVLRVFFGLWISGQMKLHRISGYHDIGGKEEAAA
jgi:transposase-like protein